MIKNIYVPKHLQDNNITVQDVLVKSGDRIHIDNPLVNLSIDNLTVPVLATHDAWVKYVVTKPGKSVSPGDLILVIDVISTVDYQIDESEVSPQTELGETGRRGAERDGQRKFGEGYANALFDAPEKSIAQESEMSDTHAFGQGTGRRGAGGSLKENPLLQNMKEGLPPKMQANAAGNFTAVKNLAEEATRDPQLRKQLSNQLQQQLGVGSAPSTAPTYKAGG